VYESRNAQNFGLYQKFDPVFPGISRAQTKPLSAAAPSLHRFLAHIPEPQIRVPKQKCRFFSHIENPFFRIFLLSVGRFLSVGELIWSFS
jgi:hypothetical protein